MNRISTDLFPMQVNPLDFKRGDVVKKVITDNIQTPYVGIVTAVIPSTNKVEVQWPHSNGIEDPWDLVKVNPLFNPPTVTEDKSYKTYQNQNADKFVKGLNHYNILEEFLNEHLNPVIMKASSLYNSGKSKAEAFFVLSKKNEKHLVEKAINKVFNDSVDIVRQSSIFTPEGVKEEASLRLKGDSTSGYLLSYKLGEELKVFSFNNIQEAVKNFSKMNAILEDLDSKQNFETVVAKVNLKRKENKELEEESLKDV